MPLPATCETWRARSGGGGCSVVAADHLEGGCGERTRENERLQLAERGYGRCHLSHRGAINTVAVKVQEDDVGAGL